MNAKMKALFTIIFYLSCNLCQMEINENLNSTIDATKNFSEKASTMKSQNGNNETFSMQSSSGKLENLFCAFMFSSQISIFHVIYSLQSSVIGKPFPVVTKPERYFFF